MLKKFQLSTVVLFFSLFVVNLTAQNWKSEISSQYFYIKVAGADKYLDLPGEHPATAKKDLQFQIWNKNDDTFERTFIFPSINGTEFFAIRNKAGYIMDVGGKDKLNVKEKLQKKTGKKFKMKKDDGAEVQTWTYNSKGVNKWQQWRLIVVDKNRVIIENVFTENALGVKGNINKNGTKIVSAKRSNDDDQFFVLEYADGPNKGKLLEFD